MKRVREIKFCANLQDNLTEMFNKLTVAYEH